VSSEAGPREQILRAGHSLFARGLTAGSSGNISVRADDGWLITPTNSCLGALNPEDIAHIGTDGRQRSGAPPSKEWFFHKAAYEARSSISAVVHLHSTHSAAVSCLSDLDCANCLPPLTAYHVMRVGEVPLLPYFRPGDAALGPAVGGLVRRHTAVLLANHGPVVVGRNLEAALYAAEELEETAKLFLLLHGRRYSPLSQSQIEDLRQHFPTEAAGPS
jgi:ribulose-5-phosphate 4-epimerase/fuculose-1-phosphate aldolase